MTQKLRIWGIAAALFAGIAGLFYAKQPPVQLIAEGNVPIYGLLESAAKREGKIIQLAKKGDHFAILDCHDMKSFFVLEVDIGAGKKGFILDGDYRMSSIPSCS